MASEVGRGLRGWSRPPRSVAASKVALPLRLFAAPEVGRGLRGRSQPPRPVAASEVSRGPRGPDGPLGDIGSLLLATTIMQSVSTAYNALMWSTDLALITSDKNNVLVQLS